MTDATTEHREDSGARTETKLFVAVGLGTVLPDQWGRS